MSEQSEYNRKPYIETVEIPPDRLLHSYLIDLVTSLVQKSDKKNFTIVDFGCKEGDFVDALCHEFLIKDDRIPTPNIHIAGYDPSLNSNSYAIQRALKKAQKNGELTAEFTSEIKKIPERADLVFAHFSLHHASDLKEAIQKEICEHISPSRIIVAEYDFQQIHHSSQKADLEEFKRVFESNQAGERERDEFIKKHGSEEAGWQDCYAFHTKFNEQDYRREIEEAGYRVVNRIVPTSNLDVDRYKFMLIAVPGRQKN